MRILELNTGLFPDAGTVAEALRAVGASELRRVDLTRPEMTSQDWDQVVADILDSDLVVTL